MKTFDVVVIGAGALGLSAAYFLAKAGLRIACVDQFTPPHPWSGSVGETRLFRQAYFEDVRYLPLLKRALVLWQQLESVCKTQLLFQNGLLVMSDNSVDINEKLAHNARLFDIPIEWWSHAELARRVKTLTLPKSYHASFEKSAGVLRCDLALKVLAHHAEHLGATMAFGEKIIGIDHEGDDVIARGINRSYRAKQLVIAAGAFINELVTLPMTITIKRAVQFWFKAPSHYSIANNFPCFAFARAQDFIYGLPAFFHDEIKVACYQPSDTIQNPCTTSVQFTDAELAPVKAALDRHMRDVDSSCSRHKVCFYDLTHDENFLIDRDPNDERIIIAGGGSGHAFKFAPVIGEIVASMVQKNSITLDIDFLCLRPHHDELR